jgi:hypothetical protein
MKTAYRRLCIDPAWLFSVFALLDVKQVSGGTSTKPTDRLTAERLTNSRHARTVHGSDNFDPRFHLDYLIASWCDVIELLQQLYSACFHIDDV